jgi:hypothetical protein
MQSPWVMAPKPAGMVMAKAADAQKEIAVIGFSPRH